MPAMPAEPIDGYATFRVPFEFEGHSSAVPLLPWCRASFVPKLNMKTIEPVNSILQNSPHATWLVYHESRWEYFVLHAI